MTVIIGSPEPEFQVALSFAGEQRAYVRDVASELAKQGVRAFFDEENEVELWGKNLIEEFQRIYMTDSHVVVMFVSKEYAEKPWTRHERRSALARALQERREYVLPARFDDTVLEGLDPNLGYLQLRDRPPQLFAEAILQKLVKLGGRVERGKAEFRAKDAEGGAQMCRVVVHDPGGEPIEGASVLLVAHNGTVSQGKTDPNLTASPTCPPRSVERSRFSSLIFSTVQRSTASTTTRLSLR
jgi:TIR domain-containing protein